MVDEERKLTVVLDDGSEKDMEIILTFRENGKDYVVYYDPDDPNEETDIYVATYDDEWNLYPLESEEEWDMVEEVINAYFDEIQDKESDR